MHALAIRLKRHPDGSASLTLTRADGSVTWQRQRGQTGNVFPSHDITHYAVETALGYEHGFYGLVADGWEMADFAAPWPRGPIPLEARNVELIVGLFDAERRSGERWSAEQFSEHAATYVAASKVASALAPPVFTDDQIARVRAVRDDALARWYATTAGGALELRFERTTTHPASASAPSSR